jgi:hypothetical protein
VGFLYGQFPDGNCLQAWPRGARLALRANSHIAPAFSSHRKTSSCLAPSSSLTSFAAVRVGFLYGQFPDGNCLQAWPRVARLALWANSHIAPAFSSHRKTSSCLAPSSSLTSFAAERVGFEPTVPLRTQLLSKQPH